MKKSARYLQKLYAFLLLSAISISVLPLKLLHHHEGELIAVSSVNHNQTESFTAGDQSYCPVCLYAFIHHYLPAHTAQAAEIQFFTGYSATEIAFHLPAEPDFRYLRGPPSR